MVAHFWLSMTMTSFTTTVAVREGLMWATPPADSLIVAIAIRRTHVVTVRLFGEVYDEFIGHFVRHLWFVHTYYLVGVDFLAGVRVSIWRWQAVVRRVFLWRLWASWCCVVSKLMLRCKQRCGCGNAAAYRSFNRSYGEANRLVEAESLVQTLYQWTSSVDNQAKWTSFAVKVKVVAVSLLDVYVRMYE